MSKKIMSGEGWKVIPAEPVIEEIKVESKPPEKQKIKISVEKRNKGKVVTVISNLILSEEDIVSLAKSLKTACGTGGTVNNSNIEIQGNNTEKAKSWLISNNWGLK